MTHLLDLVGITFVNDLDYQYDLILITSCKGFSIVCIGKHFLHDFLVPVSIGPELLPENMTFHGKIVYKGERITYPGFFFLKPAVPRFDVIQTALAFY